MGHELDGGVEFLTAQGRVRRRVGHFVVKIVGPERLRAGHAENVLGQHIERAGTRHGRVLHAGGSRHDGGPAFEHLEAVCRHQDGPGRFVEPMVGAADPLDQPARALGGPDVDAEVDIAPIDSEVEGGGRHHGLEPAFRHGGLDPAALADIERAMMQRDGQVVAVDPPQVPEQLLGLEPRVDEQQGQLGGLDRGVDLPDGVSGTMARPGQPLLRVEHGDMRRRAFRGDHEGGRRFVPARQVGAQLVRLAHRCRESDRLHARCDAPKPGEIEGQQVAALGGHQRMQFVEHDALEVGKQNLGVGAGQQQRELFGGGEQDVGRIAALALALGGGGVAGAGLDPDGQAHLGDRGAEIAGDIDRQRLQGRDVQGVQNRPAGRRCRKLDEARQEAGKRLAGAGRGDQAARSARPRREPEVRAGEDEAPSPGPRTSRGSLPGEGSVRVCRAQPQIRDAGPQRRVPRREPSI